MAGASLGGGLGFYSSLYGPICDSIASVEMVTGTGALVTASKSENSELFWAMKGAGFSYGAVTSLTYNVYDYPNGGQAMTADMIFPLSQIGALWTFAKSYVGKQPKELSIGFSMLFSPAVGEVGISLLHSRKSTKKNIAAPHHRKYHLRRTPL
jgi:fumiquinazoline A oxidase